MTQSTNNSEQVLAEQLKSLPELEPTAALRQRLDALLDEATEVESHADRNRLRNWGIAAVILAGLLMGLIIGEQIKVIELPPESVAVTQPEASEPTEFSDLGLLIAQSALLDQVNATLPTRGRVRNVRSAGRITALEDRVRLLDAALAQPEISTTRRAALMRQRVGLMDTLVEMRSGQQPTQWL